MKYWLQVYSEETWDEFCRSNQGTTAFKGGGWSQARKFAVGDVLLCYVKGFQIWVGILEVREEAHLDKTSIFGSDDLPVRLTVEPREVLAFDNGISVKSLVGRVSFLEPLPVRKNWGHFVRRSPRLMLYRDGQVIASAIREAARSSQTGPSERRVPSGLVVVGPVVSELEARRLVDVLAHTLGLTIKLQRTPTSFADLRDTVAVLSYFDELAEEWLHELLRSHPLEWRYQPARLRYVSGRSPLLLGVEVSAGWVGVYLAIIALSLNTYEKWPRYMERFRETRTNLAELVNRLGGLKRASRDRAIQMSDRFLHLLDEYPRFQSGRIQQIIRSARRWLFGEHGELPTIEETDADDENAACDD
ncbi:MAG: hypothetical protein IH989_07040 [Planctomycetes bacterium]|nr:hypothetical protein [Planctomycetota bacterium]